MSTQNSPLPDTRSNTSEAAVSGLNLNLDPIERYIFDGFQQRFLNVFGCRSVWTSASDEIQALKRIFQDGSKSYPYAFFNLNTWTESTERGNTFMASRRGQLAVLSSDQLRGFRVSYIPVDFQISIKFVTNDFKEVIKYASRWLFARRKGWLKFDVTYGKVHFSVSVVPSESISFPLREADPENVTEYMVTTDLIIVGYISDPTLIEQQIADTIEVTGLMQDGPTSAGTEVWSFRRSARPEMNTNLDDPAT